MKCKRRIRNLYYRTVICIVSILLISIGFSFGDAMADNCQGGAGCLVCAERPHGHIPGAEADMQNPDCSQGGQTSNCGFEASQIPDDIHGIVSSVSLYHQVYAGNFAAASDESRQTRLTGELVPPFALSDSGGTVPIYLINQSQLC